MQIPQNFSEAKIGMVFEKDGQSWKILRSIDQTSLKGGTVVREKYIQFVSESGAVGFHTYSVEVMS